MREVPALALMEIGTLVVRDMVEVSKVMVLLRYGGGLTD